jgi:hypothetical protein
MNIIVRKAGDKGGETSEGPFIYTPGVTVFTAIAAIINNPDYGDITDPDDGFDIMISKEGEKLETKYSIMPRRISTPLAVADDEYNRILDNAADLLYVELSEDPGEDKELGEGFIVRLKPYDRIITDYGIEPGMSTAEINATAVDSDPKTNAKNVLKERKAHKTREVVAAEPVDDTKDEGDDDAVEEAFKTSRTRRRQQRRS